MGGATPARGNFATLTDADLAFFRNALEGDDAVRTDAKSLDEANEDWMRKYKGKLHAPPKPTSFLPQTTPPSYRELFHLPSHPRPAAAPLSRPPPTPQLCRSIDEVSFNICFATIHKGKSRVLLLPRTTEQVAAVMRHCNARRLAVVPQVGLALVTLCSQNTFNR
jgi:hypothetical protein